MPTLAWPTTATNHMTDHQRVFDPVERQRLAHACAAKAQGNNAVLQSVLQPHSCPNSQLRFVMLPPVVSDLA